jgi:hypothetical protein
MRYFLLFVFVITICTGCLRDTVLQNVAPPEMIFPLKADNSWTYALTNFNEDGSTALSTDLNLVVMGQRQYFGKQYFALVNSADITDTVFAIRSEKEKVFAPNFYAESEATFFKWPVEEGEVLTDVTANGIREMIQGFTTPVTINNFTGYKVTDSVYLNGQILYYENIYFSQNIGMIGLEDFHPNINHTGYFKIQDFKLKTYVLK